MPKSKPVCSIMRRNWKSVPFLVSGLVLDVYVMVKLYRENVVEVLANRNYLEYPIYNNAHVRKAIQQKDPSIRDATINDLLVKMRAENTDINSVELGSKNYAYWLPDEQMYGSGIEKAKPGWRQRTLQLLNSCISFVLAGLVVSVSVLALSSFSAIVVGEGLQWDLMRLTVGLLFSVTFLRWWAYLVRKPHIGPGWSGKGIYKHYGFKWIQYNIWGSWKAVHALLLRPAHRTMSALFGLVLLGFFFAEVLMQTGDIVVSAGYAVMAFIGVDLIFVGWTKVTERMSKLVSPITLPTQGINATIRTEQELIDGN